MKNAVSYRENLIDVKWIIKQFVSPINFLICIAFVFYALWIFCMYYSEPHTVSKNSFLILFSLLIPYAINWILAKVVVYFFNFDILIFRYLFEFIVKFTFCALLLWFFIVVCFSSIFFLDCPFGKENIESLKYIFVYFAISSIYVRLKIRAIL